MFSTFFLLTLYTQQVLRYSALQTGLAMLATRADRHRRAVAAEAARDTSRAEVRSHAGLAFMFAGLVWFAQIPLRQLPVRPVRAARPDRFGTGFSFVPISIIALAGVPEEETGLASGLMNTTQQVGGALGVAVVATIFAERLNHDVARGISPPQALVNGFSTGYWLLAFVAAAGCVLTLVLLRRVHLGEPGEQPVDTHIVSPFCVNRAATSSITTLVLGDGAPEGAPSLTS